MSRSRCRRVFSAIGWMAGARLPRGRPAHGVHQRQERRARCKGHHQADARRGKQASNHLDHVVGLVVNDRVHGDDPVEAAEIGFSMSLTTKLDAA